MASDVFLDLGDAQRRIGLFLDYYSFQRPNQGIDGLVPADRFFQAAPEVRQTFQARVAANALELARHGRPSNPFYLTGQVGGQPLSVKQTSAHLKVTTQRFHVLREQALQTALAALKRGMPGRPSHTSTAEEEEIARLLGDNEQLQRAEEAARLREEIALILPGRSPPTEKKRRTDSAR